MKKKLITYVLLLSMLFSLFSGFLPKEVMALSGSDQAVNILFEDSCSSLAAAGWSKPTAYPQSYILDSERYTNGIVNLPATLAAPPGEYLFYGEANTAATAATLTRTFKSTERLDTANQWELQFTAKINELVTLSGSTAATTAMSRGLTFDIRSIGANLTGKRFQISFHSMDAEKGTFKISHSTHSATPATATTISEVYMPDSSYHTWKLAFDGVNTVTVSADDKVIAALTTPGANFSGAATYLGITSNVGGSITGTKNEVYITDLAFKNLTANTILVSDNCDSLQAAGWTQPTAYPHSLLLDSYRWVKPDSEIYLPSIAAPAGKYIIFGGGANSGALTAIQRPVDIGQGPWELEINAAVNDLMTTNLNPGKRGLYFDIVANGLLYRVLFGGDNKIRAATSEDTYVEQSAVLPKDGINHNWRISFDGKDTLRIKLDGLQIASFTGIGFDAPSIYETDSMAIVCDPRDWESGYTNLSISRIAIKNSAIVEEKPFYYWAAPENLILNDDCTNIADAKWTMALPNLPGTYILDNAAYLADSANPVYTKPAVEGQYLFYGDNLATGSNYTQLTRGRISASDSINTPIEIGRGPWLFEFDAKFADTVTPTANAIYRGLSFEITAAGIRYKVTFNDNSKIISTSNLSGSTEQIVQMPIDGMFHKWAIAYDGGKMLSLLLDDVRVASFEGTGVAAAIPDSIKIINATLNWKSGTNEIYFDNIRMYKAPADILTYNPFDTLLDKCDDLSSYGYTVSVPKHGLYITDNTNSTGKIPDMLTPSSGKYLFYAQNGVTGSASMYKQIKLGDESWSVEFDAAFKDILTSNTAINGSVVLEVYANSKLYRLLINSQNKLLIDAGNGIQSIETAIPLDNTENKFGIYHDANGNLSVVMGTQKLALIQGAAGIDTNEPDGVKFTLCAEECTGTSTNLELSSIRVMRRTIPVWLQYIPAISGCSLYADNGEINGVVSFYDLNPDWINNENVKIEGSIVKDGISVASVSKSPSGIKTPMNFNIGDNIGRVDVVLKLISGNTVMDTLSKKIEIYKSVNELIPDERVTAKANEAYIFTQMDKVKTISGDNYFDAGWKLAPMQMEGRSETGFVIENTYAAHMVQIPAKLNGWFRVYIGYVTGTESFKVTAGDQTKEILIEDSVVPEIPTQLSDTYGDKVIREIYAFSGHFNGNTIGLSSVTGKHARIAYVKLAGLTEQEIGLVNTADDGGKRVIYNNDGYSDYYTEGFDNKEELIAETIDTYIGQDVERMDWSLGVTFFLNYENDVTGRPYDGITEQQKIDLMREGDIRAMESILGFVERDEVSIEILAARGKEIGVPVNAALRMSGFYSPAHYPWLNGPIYDQYSKEPTDYRQVNASGVRIDRISYIYPEVRQTIINILLNASSYPNVDGVTLDFCRYPYVFSNYEQELIDAYVQNGGEMQGTSGTQAKLPKDADAFNAFKAEIMTQFMRDVRTALPNEEISVRVPKTGSYEYALDVQAWINENLVDVIIPSAIGQEDFSDDKVILNMVLAARENGSAIRVYGGIEAVMSGTDLTKAEEEMIKRGEKINKTPGMRVSKEQYLLRAREMYTDGYDGIYIHNNWDGVDSLGNLGDKVKVEKWYQFAYPAEWVQNFVTIAAPTAVPDLPTDILEAPVAAGKTTTVTIPVSPVVSDNIADIVLSEKIISDAIRSVSEAVQENGSNPIIEININAPETAKSIHLTLPKSAVESMVRCKKINLLINTPLAAISLDAKALSAAADQADTNITIKFSNISIESIDISEEIRQITGERPVYDITIKSGENTISVLNGFKAEISIPYYIKSDEEPNKIVIYYVDEKGKFKTVQNYKYDIETGKITFKVNHLSSFVIGYRSKSLMDISTVD